MSTSPLTTSPTASAWRTVIAAGGVVAALGALGYISVVIFDPDATAREAYQSPLSAVGCVAATLGLVALVHGLLHSDLQLPRWAVLTSAAGLFFAAANAWFFGTAILAITDHTSNAIFDDIGGSGWLLVTSAPKMILCLIGFAGLAVAGMRRHSIPTGAAALLGVAALASLIPPFPPGVILSSLAFWWIARSAAKR